MSSRRTFISAGALAAVAGGMPLTALAAPAAFDRAAFEARVRAPFAHRQAFASALTADGAVLGFMRNSLDAYDGPMGEPGSLHAAAVLYHHGVALGLDDDAWRRFALANRLRAAGDRVSASGDGNPYLHSARGGGIAELQARHASFFVCRNALNDLATTSGTDLATLAAHLLPGTMLVPAGVAAINALQEEHFTLFVAA